MENEYEEESFEENEFVEQGYEEPNFSDDINWLGTKEDLDFYLG